MATPVNDSYTAPSGEQINAGQWAVADYDASAALSSDVAGTANPGDTYTITANLTNLGALALGGTVFIDEIEDGNLTLVPGSATTNAGSVTQDDTRIEIAVGTLTTSAIITYQVTVAAGMPDGYVSSRATLDAANLALEFSNLLIESVGDQDITNQWPNMSFDVDVLTPGGTQDPANSWSVIKAQYPNDGETALDGNNVGYNTTPLTFAENQSNYNATPGTYRISFVSRRTPNISSGGDFEIEAHFDGSAIATDLCHAWKSSDLPTYPWGLLTGYVSLKDFTSDRFNLRIKGDTLGGGVAVYIDQIQVTKLGDFHPKDLIAPNASGVRLGGVSCYADTYTMGQTTGRIYNKPFVAGDVVARVPRVIFGGTYETDQYQDQATLRPSWQANGALRFDGIDDFLAGYSTPLPGIGIGDEPFTVVFRANISSVVPSNYKTILQLEEVAAPAIIFIDKAAGGTFYLRSSGGTQGVALTNFYSTYGGQDLIYLCHYEDGNSFLEILGGTNYPAVGAEHFAPIDAGIGAPALNFKEAPSMDFWGYVIYPGWNTGINSQIATFLNSIDGSQP